MSTTNLAKDADPADDKTRLKNMMRLFIANLHQSTTEGDLIKIFSEYGTVKNIDYKWHKVGEHYGKPKGYVFLEFESEVSAKRAMKAGNFPHEITARGRKLAVKYADMEEIRSTDSSNPYSASTIAFGETSTNLKRGRDHDGNTEEHLKKLKNVRAIEDKMKKLEATLRKLG